jgi:hypothetical protein
MLTVNNQQQVPPMRPQAHLKSEIMGGGFPSARGGWVPLAWPAAVSGALSFSGMML